MCFFSVTRNNLYVEALMEAIKKYPGKNPVSEWVYVVQLAYKCSPGLWVDSNEAGTLLVGLGPHSFDQFELLPVDEGAVLFSPLCNTPGPARI